MNRRRMFAVSAEGYGLIAGTLAYSRREAIERWLSSLPANSFGHDWGAAKRAGYRTVQALVEITGRYGTRRTTRRGR